MANRKLIEWLLLLLALSVLGGSVYFNHLGDLERHRNGEADRLQALSTVIATNIETDLAATSDAMGSFIHNELRQPAQAGDQALASRLDALDKAMPGVLSMTVVDSHGLSVVSNWVQLQGKEIAYGDFFQVIKESPNPDTLYLTAPFRLASGALVMAVARVVPAAGGGFGGLLVATLDSEYFTAKFRAASYAPDVWAFVMHGDGVQVLNFPSRPSLDGKHVDQSGSVFAQHRERGGLGSLLEGDVTGDGEQRLVAMRTVDGPTLHMDAPIVIGLSREMGAIVAPLDRQAHIELMFLAGMAILGAVFLYLAQRRRAQELGMREHQLEQEILLRAISESELRFRTLIEDAPLPIAMLRGGRFIYSNRRYRVLHGYAGDADIIGMPWHDLIAFQSRLAIAEHESMIDADSPREQHFEVLAQDRTGHLVPVYTNAVQVRLADGPATLVFAQDISAQKKAENAMLVARDAAEAASRGKAEFLANMSHEIRSPLNAILGLAYLLQRTQLDPEARGMVARIRMAGQSLLGIINDILDVSKIEAGHMSLERVAFPLGEVIDQVANAMGVAAGDKAIELVVQALPPGVERVVGDPLRLQQVLVNLAGNAVKFTSAGHVEVAVELLARQGDVVSLRFRVRDTGIGIDPSMHKQIFSPFSQADNSTTRRFGGTGLGLTICHRLVGLMGGELGLASVPGQGSEFSFVLAMPLDVAAAAPCELLGLRLLVADDNALARAAVGAMARGLGCLVDEADSAKAALAAAGVAAEPRAVLLDWTLPGEDVAAAAAALRAATGTSGLLIVMANTYATSELTMSSAADMVDAVLHKPVTPSSLHAAVLDARRRRATALGIPDAPGETAAQDLDGIRVLVVDDSDINRDVAEGILAAHGARTSLAENGQAALDFLAAHPGQTDIVLMDLQMPVMDGIEATRRLRLMPSLADLPVIALTAGVFRQQQDIALDAGMNHFITKPFNIASTVALIRQLAGREALTGAASAAGAADSAAVDAGDLALDIARGLQLWSGMERYRHYLDLFVDNFGESGTTLTGRLAQGSVDTGAALAHKLAGAAANLALMPVSRAAREVEDLLSNALDAGAAIAALQSEYQRALLAIAALQSAADAKDTIHGRQVSVAEI